MTLRNTALYPFLLAPVRVLSFAANNPGAFSVGDLLLVLGATVTLVAAIYALAALLLRGRLKGTPPALVTFLVVAWLFVGPGVAEWLSHAGYQFPPFVLPATGTLGSVLLIHGLARRPYVLGAGASFLTVTYSILVIWLAIDIAMDRKRSRNQVAESALAKDLAVPVPTSAPPSLPIRSIYVIVLDEYANGAVLREVLGFDNRPFEDSLRALGFHIPASVRSNYTHTSLSIPSLLNGAHMDRVQRELPPGSTDPTLPNHLLATNRAARFLQSRGYRYVFFPSSWWHATRGSPIADSVVDVDPTLSPARELSRTDFRRVVWQSTMMAYLHHDAGGDGEIVRGTLEGIGRLPSIPEPVFAVAHVVSPHSPYVFDRLCRARPHLWHREPASYLAQLQCLNAMLLETVTHLIRDSHIAPVIVLQGDHGTAFREYSKAPSTLQVPAAAARERFGAFGAYYLPNGGEAAFGDSVTVVNVMGHVLRRYFSADLPYEPDEHYLSLERSPFDFRRVDRAWLSVADSLDRVASRVEAR